MKNLIFFLSALLTGSLNLNAQQVEPLDHPTDAQVILTHYDGRPNTRVVFLSNSGQEIKLLLDYDEGSTFNVKRDLVVENGEVVSDGHQNIGGLHKVGQVDSEKITIRQTETGKLVTIKLWNGEPVTIPSSLPRLSGWQKMPPSPDNATAVKIIAGGRKLLVIDNTGQLHEWNFGTKSWTDINKSVNSAAVDMFSSIWAITGDEIQRSRFFYKSAQDKNFKKGQWESVPSPAGGAKAVVAGGTRALVIGNDNLLYEWNFFENKWKAPINRKVNGAAVDHKNSLWILEGTTIYRKKSGGDWIKMTGAAKEIFAGGSKVFVTGTDGQQYEWNFKNDNSWTRAGVYPISTAVDINNTIYYIDKKNVIYSLYYAKQNEVIVPDISKNDGEWTFGYGTPGADFSLFTQEKKEGPESQITRKYKEDWWSVAQNTSSEAWTDREHNTYPPKADGAMVFHPGQNRDQSSKARFTAKTTGIYTFNIKWSLIDAQGELVSAEVYTNASSKGTGWTTLIEEQVTDQLPNRSLSKEFTVSLKAGEVVSVEVENEGDWQNDSTLIEMSAK